MVCLDYGKEGERMKNDDKLPWHQRIAAYIIIAGLLALYLLIGVGLFAIIPESQALAAYLSLAVFVVGLLFIANLPLEIKKTKGPLK